MASPRRERRFDATWRLPPGVIAAILGAASAAAGGGAPDGHIIYVPLPARVAEGDPLGAHGAASAPLEALIAEHARIGGGDKAHRSGDVVVILTQPDGEPILPDLAAARHAAAADTTNELAFTFDSPLFPWSAEELATISTTLNACYPVAKDIYGPPAFAITVNVRHDPNISVAGLYNPSLNEMALTGLDAGALCHEMIHAFRDDDIVALSSFEEGMTRAAEIEVFDRLAPAYVHPFDQNHSYTYDVFYEALNRPAIGSSAGFFAGYVSPLLRYQLAGYAWGKGIVENPRFLADFNALLYTTILTDPTAQFTESTLKALAAAAQPTLEGQPFAAWYAGQGVLDTAPPVGYQLYQRVNQFVVDFFSRDDATGVETMQANASVSWALYDDRDALLGSGSDVTSANGFIDFTLQAAALLAGYTGRVKVVASTSTSLGPIIDTVFTAGGVAQGVFGVVADASEGTVTITPLDDPAAAVTVDVVHGAFAATSLGPRRGRFVAVFADASGRTVSQQFTKDASDYFVSLALPGETDADGDGVRDSSDHCLATPPGAVVNADGCSIDQLVPCAGPRSGGNWKNHGEYVSSTAHAAGEFRAQGLISEDRKGFIVVQAGQSNCGSKVR